MPATDITQGEGKWGGVDGNDLGVSSYLYVYSYFILFIFLPFIQNGFFLSSHEQVPKGVSTRVHAASGVHIFITISHGR